MMQGFVTTSFLAVALVGIFHVIVILNMPCLIARMRFSGTFLVDNWLMKQEVYDMLDYRLLFTGCISIHVFGEMAAERTHKLIHVGLIRMLQPRFLRMAVFNESIRLTFYHVGEIGQEHGDPEFL